MDHPLSCSLNELREKFSSLGIPTYRAGQVIKWLYRGVRSFDEMTDLPKELRDSMSKYFQLYMPQLLKKQISAEDGTIKYLWRLWDGNSVECVLMNYKFGTTICISTQVGCRQGCAFCASTIGGLVRSLEPFEMIDEVLFSGLDSGKKISHIVLMGIGEPLDNFENVVKFLRLVNAPEGLNIGLRHISLSTCGITERMDELAALNLPITLSVSLHAPDDETRSRIMPANRGRGVDLLVEKCRSYAAHTGRRVTFEYAMIDGVNDTAFHAKLLAKRAKSCGAHINLIPLNRVEGKIFQPTTAGHMKAFVRTLENEGVNVTVRRKLGGDIDASCGQLRRKETQRVYKSD